MPEAKPIFVAWLSEYDMLPQSHIKEVGDNLSKSLPDYHVLICRGKETKIEVFNSDKIAPIEIEELKRIVNDSRQP